MRLINGVCTLLLVSTIVPCSSVLVNIRSFQGAITRAHNYYRRIEPASNMRALTWDYSLERRAARWSETCYFEHQRRGLGENLAYFTSTGRAVPPRAVIQRSLGLWAAEKRLFPWSTNCGAACHYTQLIWATTRRVGCALSYCPLMRSGGGRVERNSMYFVCFYTPAGNYIGQYPFIPGRRCSRCGRGQSCVRGLCSAGYRMFGRRRRRSAKLSSKEEFLGLVDERANGD